MNRFIKFGKSTRVVDDDKYRLSAHYGQSDNIDKNFFDNQLLLKNTLSQTTDI